MKGMKEGGRERVMVLKRERVMVLKRKREKKRVAFALHVLTFEREREREREKLQLLKPLMCIAHEHSTSVTLNYCHLLLYAATPARMHHACKKS